MTPSHYRAGGAQTDIRFAVGECSLGSILVAQSERGICAILLGDDPDDAGARFTGPFPAGQADRRGRRVRAARRARWSVLSKRRRWDSICRSMCRGTAFQQRVWQALRKIPAGSTASYTDIARHIGAPNAVRAVAQACGANALAVAIPCHRVVRNDGALSGYRWGVERKRAAARTGGTRMSAAIQTETPGASSTRIAERVEGLDWERVSQDLDAQGSAMDRTASLSGRMPGGGWTVSERRHLPQPRRDGAAWFRAWRVQVFQLSAA